MIDWDLLFATIATIGGRAMQDLVNWYYEKLHRQYGFEGSLDETVQKVKKDVEEYAAANREALSERNERAFAEASQRLRQKLEYQIEFLKPNTIRLNQDRHSWYLGPLSSDMHWPKTKSYLIHEKGWETDSVESIDRESDEVLSLLGDPQVPKMKMKGLVLGHVQGGKTANMTGVIAKAADRGYRFIIILAGMTKALRVQTQGRLESDLIGLNRYNWELQTTREDDGDFQMPPNCFFPSMPREMRRIAIVKKNVTPLIALKETLKKTPMKVLGEWPFLLIDDECDQASVNGKGKEYDWTAINGLIRELLGLLPRVTYVGYTATPFANVLINPYRPGTTIPEDLYPRDFIKALEMPRAYFGTERLFGRDPYSDDDEGAEGLDMVREVPVNEVPLLRPPVAKKRFDWDPEVSQSLGEAIRWYLLATAARYARGQRDKHSCMLVHTSIHTTVHEKLAKKIKDYVGDIGRRIGNDHALKRELGAQWSRESKKVPSQNWARRNDDVEAVLALIPEVIGHVEVCVENAVSEQRLDFNSGPKRYIVVGGSVLSRGLTIEGLVVSLFVRSSSQYDTLLQMGRWFGYRPGYEDLPRIWMTGDLQRKFRDLARIEAEIRDDIRVYPEQRITPLDFAVRIRRIPGLRITAKAKMLAAEDCDVSYSGEHVQTFRFRHHDDNWLAKNWRAGSLLVDQALEGGRQLEQSKQGRFIRDVPAAVILKFIESYGVHQDHKAFSADRITEYVRNENQSGRLTRWTVGVVEPTSTTWSADPLGQLGAVRTVKRARLIELCRDDADIKSLMSRRDILIDVSNTGADVGSWRNVKDSREKAGDKTPLILLYGIEARSEPKDTEHRTALDAVRDVLGVGIVFTDLGKNPSYVRVRLQEMTEEGDENLEEELEHICQQVAVVNE